jgi:hypothetical protein
MGNDVVKIVKELDGFNGAACLIEHDGNFYVVSSVHAMFTGFETLIFPADKEGYIERWTEVGGGRGIGREEAIRDFEEHGPYKWDED